MNFPQAMQAIIDGNYITKLEWNDSTIVCGLVNGRLSLRKADGIWYGWTINDGDMLGTDWVVWNDYSSSASASDDA